MSDPVLAVRGLEAGYADRSVVHDLDIKVHGSEIVALLGANGAGKTTTLRAISGLARTVAGTVSLQGRPITGERPHRIARLGLAHVPEDRALFGDLTVDENLRLGTRSGRALRRTAVDDVFDLLPELAGMRKRRAGVLSGGEQQMLALGRALVARPSCLLVDEMSLGLAPVIVQRLAPTIRRIADEAGIAVVLVEQHVPLALDVADRAYVLAQGRVALHAPTAELADRPDLLRASYLGADDTG